MTEEFFNHAIYAASVMTVARNVKEFLDDVCAWCGDSLNGFISPAYDKQNRKYCSFECMRRFMGYEDD